MSPSSDAADGMTKNGNNSKKRTSEPPGLHLVVDAVGNKYGGTAVVLAEVLATALAHEAIGRITAFASPTDERKVALPHDERLTVVDVPEAEPALGRLWWAWQGLERRARSVGADVLLGLNGFGGSVGTMPAVVFLQQPLLYDRQALRRCPTALRWRMWAIRRLTRRSVRAADHVMTQTDAIRQAAATEFGIALDKITAYPPSAPRLPEPGEPSSKLAAMRDAAAAGQAVLLYVGSDAPYKNLEIVAAALTKIAAERRPRWFATLSPESPVCRGGAAEALYALSREELAQAYRLAGALVLPSLTETVGLPMLEAMRFGVPVAAADRPYAHAVCEDAAEWFDPLDADSCAAALCRMLYDGPRRTELIARGLALIARRDADDPLRRMIDKVVAISEGHHPAASESQA